jgi:molybdopterin converting factor small subunit
MRDLTGGEKMFVSSGSTVGELLEAFDRAFPGAAGRITTGNRLKPGLAVAVDGEVSFRGIKTPLKAESSVQLVPALKGG